MELVLDNLMEFGSDFHFLDYPKGGKSLLEYFPESNLYASGRQALLALALDRSWKKLWVPSYFCEETLNGIQRAGIELRKYNITPLVDPLRIISSLPVNPNDGLLVVNYFGLFDKRDFSGIDCEVVEDHTHNLIGNWALKSNSDWCIASLRKTLPIADGGILWSPKHQSLPKKPSPNELTNSVMNRRVIAMNLKRSYLRGSGIDKGEFLKIFSDTEKEFDRLPISAISNESLQVINNIDIPTWYDTKHRNWDLLHDNLRGFKAAMVLTPENRLDCAFSLTLMFSDDETRNSVRKALIAKSVYPAILWTIENAGDKAAQYFGSTMLSIHCDGRYSFKDMETLLSLIKGALV